MQLTVHEHQLPDRLTVVMVGNQVARVVELDVDGIPIGALLVASNAVSDIDRVIECLGRLPEVLEAERWRPV